MKEIICNCEKKFQTEIPAEIDLEKKSETITEILEGRFLNVTCPACQTVLKPEFPIRLFHKKKGWDINFVPELARNEYLKSHTPSTFEDTKRTVIGYLELLEKIKCLQDGLDDRVVEYLKYHIYSKALEKLNDDEEENDLLLYYHEKKTDELDFHIHGLKPDEVALFKLPYSLYEKTVPDIQKHCTEEPFNEFLIPPYVSLNRLATWSE